MSQVYVCPLPPIFLLHVVGVCLLVADSVCLDTLQPQDAIDLVDNDIQVLGNFPLTPRIHTLLLARNRVSSIQLTLANSIPNLTNLQLESNSLNELADLDPLASFPRLTHLVLRDNPVTKKEVSRAPTSGGERERRD